MAANRGGPVRIGVVLAVAVSLVVAACSSGDDGGSDGGASGGGSADRTTTTAASPKADDDLRLDEIQVIGTHNSFHVAAPDAEAALLRAQNPEQAAERQYSHPPLTEQLAEEGIRQIELDVFADSKGGRYAKPAFRTDAGLGPLDPDLLAEMEAPGTKVLHEQDVDYHSVCASLTSCLREVKAWSDDHRTHVPIAIHIQFKDGPLIFDVPDQAVPEKWTSEAMDGLDAEITSVFDEDQIITPDDVRGDHDTLEEAVLAKDWPTLGESRGKVMFLMINPEPYRTIYLEDHEGLEGRILFTNAEPGQADASYVGLDDPVADGARISQLVEQGYLVRTRADANGTDAEADDTTRLDAALASGAQWVSTDFPGPDGAQEQYDTGYTAQLPGFLAARCNPVTAPEDCTDAAVEG
ncbi:MAG: putative secreted protein [Ilumatobacteraceae bacterium]|nr:putative secreted protein [Ilumatobacteraceae bacterium]